MSTRMQQRRDTASGWSLANPILAEGEIGFETDSGEFRVGDGTTAWADLSPFKNIEDLGGNLDDYIPLTQKAQDLGVATLDGDGSVPLSQLATALSTAQGYADTAKTDAQTFATNSINALDTDDIEEGTTNKYFTDSRAQTATAANIATAKSEAISAAALDATNKADAAQTAAISTSNAYADSAIADLVNAAPGTLDTLNELAAAIGDDPSFAVTVANLVSDAQTDAQDFATNADSALYIQVTSDIATAVTTAEDYADSLAPNYDVAGSATNALSSANAYTDAHAGDSTNIHGIADTAALATKSYVDNAVDTYNLDTTNVHGIADTSLLETLSGAQAKADAAQSAAEIHADLAAATAQQNAEDYADGLASNYEPNNAVSTHNLTTTSVHGIADTAALATKTYADNAATTAQTAAESYADTVAGNAQSAAQTYADALTTSEIAEGTSLYFTDERAQDAVGNNLGAGLSYDDVSGQISVDTTAIQERVANVSDTEIGYLDGTASNIQTQIDGKAASSHTHAQSDITNLVTDLGNKADISGDTFTGDVSIESSSQYPRFSVKSTNASGYGIVSYRRNDGNGFDLTYDNTNDSFAINRSVAGNHDSSPVVLGPTGNLSLPQSTTIGNVSATELETLNGVTSAIQTQIDAKANLSGATFTGDVTVETDLIIDGNLTVSGTTTTVSAQNLVVSDPLIYIGEGNTDNLVDLGIVSSFNDGTYQHAGIVRDASAGKWKLFKGVADEPTTTINFTQGSLDDLAMGALEATSATIGDVSNTEIQYLSGVTSSIQNQIDNVLPSQTGNTGKYLTTDGSTTSWATLNASPALDDLSDVSVTSVATNDVVYYNGTSWVNKNVGAIPTLINAQSGTTYSLALADAGKVVEVSNASAISISVPTDASVAFPVGTQITILQTGAGQITVAATTPETTTVNYTPGNKLRAQWSSATLIKRAENTWVLIGDLA